MKIERMTPGVEEGKERKEKKKIHMEGRRKEEVEEKKSKPTLWKPLLQGRNLQFSWHAIRRVLFRKNKSSLPRIFLRPLYGTGTMFQLEK